MERPETQTILSIAERIADGAPVDWEEATDRNPNLADSIKRLRAVERIADAQRALTSRAAGSALDMTRTVTQTESSDVFQWGPLTIRAKIGQGSFGDVFRAYDPTLDREVALKLVDPSRASSALDPKLFLAEARRLARVRHPNVLVVYGAETYAGRAGIWTDLLRGRTLQQYLEQERTIGPREAALIGLELCRALAAVHREGLVHRDVKPANVMREEGGRIILMDFGAGVEASPRGTGALASTVQGTPLYMPPEQLRGEAVTSVADLYSLGVLLYHAVSGHYPIEADRYDELKEKHRTGAAVPLRDHRPDLPSEFVQVIERALDPDPERRFPSAGAFERALAATLDPGAVHPERPPTSARPANWRRWSLATGLGIAAILGVILLVRWSQSTMRPAKTPIPPNPNRQVASGTAPTSSTEPLPSGAAGVGNSVHRGPLVANASLYRGDGARRKPLQDGARIAVGDALSLTIQGADSMYVYVLNEDSNGDVYVLYPVSGLEPKNPLPPGVPRRLPGRFGAQAVNWEVTSAGGQEHVLVLANRAPLQALEREIVRFPHAEPGTPVRYGQLSRAAVGVLRSIGGMTPSTDPVSGPSHLSELLGRVRRAGGSVSQPWVYQIRLENSGRE